MAGKPSLPSLKRKPTEKITKPAKAPKKSSDSSASSSAQNPPKVKETRVSLIAEDFSDDVVSTPTPSLFGAHISTSGQTSGELLFPNAPRPMNKSKLVQLAKKVDAASNPAPTPKPTDYASAVGGQGGKKFSPAPTPGLTFSGSAQPKNNTQGEGIVIGRPGLSGLGSLTGQVKFQASSTGLANASVSLGDFSTPQQPLQEQAKANRVEKQLQINLVKNDTASPEDKISQLAKPSRTASTQPPEPSL
jgi:hypothetical protein